MKQTNKLALIAILQISFCVSFSRAQDTSTQANEPALQAPFVVPAGQKFIMQLETDLHTRTTHKGDRITFKTAAEILVDNQLVVAGGSTIRGTVTKCKRAGLLFGDAEINLKIDELILPDGTALPLRATITRIGFDPVNQDKGGNSEIKGESGAGADTGTIVKAGAQGAIVGGLSAGSKGAIYGSAAGAAVAAAGMIFRRGPDIDIPRNTMLEARLDNLLEIPASFPPSGMQASQSAATATSFEAAPAAGSVLEDPPPADARRPVLKRRPGVEDGGVSAPTVSEPEIAVSGDALPEPASDAADFKVKVQMVLVDAVVRNKAGRTIDNLVQSDFKVYEDGVLQQLQSFSFDEMPLAVAVLVDRSGSVAPYISELRRIATRALQQLKPVDQVALFSFAANVNRIEPLTTDRQRIADSISTIQAGGGTNINDALFEAANYLGKAAPERRHAIIMVSDNQATADSIASEGEVIMEALETDTVLYSIKTQGGFRPLTVDLPSLITGVAGVGRIARETGGEVLKASSVSSLDAVLGSVISQLRKRYLLGYYSSNTSQGGAFHSITVRLDDRHGKPGEDYFMNARQGYYATSNRLR